jgi:peptidoglycan/xylan/chitin deacetylase (PgdA/CDA1 family)
MTNLNAKWAPVAIFAVTLMITMAPVLSGPALANKKSSTNVLTNPSTTVATTTAHYHVKGVKVLNVNAKPSSVAVGNKFSIRDTSFNNSSATITFTNGTCTSPLSITFNKTVMIENQAAAAPCKAPPQQVILTSGEQSAILSPTLSGMAYKATTPGTTNATISFNYGVETPTGKSRISDNISRVNTSDIQPGHQYITSSQPPLPGLPVLFPGKGITPNSNFHPAPAAAAALANSCNCVIFRLDDVQDSWLSNVQTTLLDQFISKNVTLDTGLIMNHFGTDTNVVNKIADGYKKGLFELFNHGWDHVNFTGVPLAVQKAWLSEGNSKMQSIFGRNTTVFIPPYDGFDANTLIAMKSRGFKVISSEPYQDPYPQFKAYGSKIADSFGIYQPQFKTDVSKIADSFGIYHLPAGAPFYDYRGPIKVKVPVSKLLSDIDKGIRKNGYAVVLLHPQDFRQVVNGQPTTQVNQTNIDDLNTIIDTQLSKNRKIESFSQVVGIALPPLKHIVPPSIKAPADIATVSNGTLTKVSLGTPTVTDNVDPSPTFINDAPSAGFPLGTTTVTWKATNHSGKSAYATQQVTIVKSTDKIRPVLSVTSPPSGATINGPSTGAVITVNGTASDAGSGVKLVQVRTNATAYNAATPKAYDDWSTWKSSVIIKQNGTNTIAARVTDYFGNQQWARIPLTVKLTPSENPSQFRIR